MVTMTPQPVGPVMGSQPPAGNPFLDQYKKDYAATQQARGGLDKKYLTTNQQGTSDQNAQAVYDQFANLFKNYVGRDATDAEFGKFYNQQLKSGKDFGTVLTPGAAEASQSLQDLRNPMAQFIGDTFQQEANKTATDKLTDLSGQASGLADQYEQMGAKSLSGLADSLRSYQVSLFDKLRPQLNLAAQAQGIQDSGGQTLQEKGALTDLGNAATATLLPYQQEIQQNANAIRYGGASAPYSLASSFAANQPGATANFGAGGLNFNNSNLMANYDQQRQLQLMRAQMLNQQDLWTGMQPSFESTLGNSFANSFGKSAGDTAGGWGKSAGGNLGQSLMAPPAGAALAGMV